MMPDPARKGKAQQFAAASAEDALNVASANIDFPGPLCHERRIVLPDGSLQGRSDRDGPYVRQVPADVPAEQDHFRRSKRETYFLEGLLHFTGTVIGFLIGGPAGAVLGSVVGARVGATAAKQSNILFKRVLKWGRFYRATSRFTARSSRGSR